MDQSLNTLDTAYGGSITINVTGGTQVLTQAQANATFISLTGSLTNNQIIGFPPIGGGRKFILPYVTLNGYGLYIRGNNANDQSGPYFLTAFGIPHGIVVTPSRIYWDYGSGYPGQLADFPYGFIPPGWLPCDGRGANTTQQDLLFDLLRYSYGGSGATFLLPDFRGRVRPMADNIGTGSAGRFFNYGINGAIGQTQIALSIGNLASHTHGDAGHAHGAYQDAHNHNVSPSALTSASGPNGQPGGGWGFNQLNTDARQPAVYVQTGYANIQPTGSGAPFQTVQPSLTVMTCIRW